MYRTRYFIDVLTSGSLSSDRG
ncbi:hypothetical protein MED222_05905 [Vibrio sp. MED222]|nr:hypothetical protein MED222_05905 [Vibrio sp. MED222]